MTHHNRPLSPHLQVWRWTITMATSFLHRVTGVAMTAGIGFFLWWLIALASGPEHFALVTGFFAHWVGRIVLFGILVAVCYHYLNGLRHLYWDIGEGYEIKTAEFTGWVALLGSIVLTIGIFAIGYHLLGRL